MDQPNEQSQQQQQEWQDSNKSAFLVGGLVMGWTIPAGSLFGIPLRIHYLLPLIVLIQLIASVGTSNPGGYLGYSILLYGLILPLTVLIHELGHSLAARCVGGHAYCILLWPLGGLAFIGHDSGPKSDLWVAFAGPLTHVPMIMIWYGLGIAGNGGSLDITDYWYHLSSLISHKFFVALCLGALWLNLVLLIFNLCLPAYPLDGGRMLANLLLICGMEINLAAKITAGIAVAAGVGIIIWGFIQFQVLTIFVGVFMLYSTAGLFAHIQSNTVAQHPMFKFSAEEQNQHLQNNINNGSNQSGGVLL